VQLTISTPNGLIDGYLAVPSVEVSGEGPWPGVVVVHDALGFNDDVRQIAGRFATAGYVAIVPNLYARGGALRCIRGVFKALNAGSGPAFDDIEAARRLIAGRGDCTGRIGVVGFCLGGGFALLTAARGFQASAPYYGMLPKDLALLDGACPVVSSFGKKAQLTGSTEDWSGYYIAETKKVLDGSWTGARRTRWGIKEGLVVMAPLNPDIPPAAVKIFEEKKSKIISGELKPFAGPIKDNTGKEMVAAGATMADATASSLNWYVEGIEGSIPK